MTPKTLRLIGIFFLVAAALVGILSLKRVADLGMTWAAPALMIFGAACVTLAKRRER